MKVIINGKEENIPNNLTILQLFKYKNIKTKASIWINGIQILLKDYPEKKIEENDNIKILKILGGG